MNIQVSGLSDSIDSLTSSFFYEWISEKVQSISESKQNVDQLNYIGVNL